MDLGIIGGADGPTTIFVSGSPAGLVLMLLLAAALALSLIHISEPTRLL